MKRILIVALLVMLLTGCGAEPTFETVADQPDLQVSAQPKQILLELPKDAKLQTGEQGDKLYLCDGFTVSLQTVEAGDLDKTLRTTTGYNREDLTLMQMQGTDGKHYRCVWAAAGEGQTQVGKTYIVDDGNYHYVLTVMVPEETAGQLASQLQDIADSFQIVDGEFSTGS